VRLDDAPASRRIPSPPVASSRVVAPRAPRAPPTRPRVLLLSPLPPDATPATFPLPADERGFPVETLRRGGSPEGIVLAPDDATLADCGVARSMGVWEHLWEDSAANQAAFAADREKVRGMVVSFMEEHPDVGRRGPAVTGDPEDETRAWDAAKKKKRAEMEAAVAAEREKKRTALEQAAAA
jgi:hypothetical protein